MMDRGLGLLWTAVAACFAAAPATAMQANLPTPESVLGFEVGADFHLATYDESIAYFEQLDAASDRLQLIEIGRTSEGRRWVIALVSSAENLRALDRYREIALRLAHARDLDDATARRLATEGKAIVHIDGGLHSSEVAHAQHNIQLAYDLVSTTNDPERLQILDNVILILWPSINPDGQNMIVDWYRSNLGTPYEVSPMPWLYQQYIGHDNNRDGYMLNMVESRVVTRVLRDWEPQLLYNHHQTAPFPTRIWIPPFAEPVSEYVHPLMWRTVNLVGMAMAQALEERGQRGAMHMGTGFDNWYPGFMDHANNFHNVAAFLTETGLYRYATPHFYTVQDFPASRRDLRPQSLYASPWQGGWWRLRDAVDYMLTASFSVLDVAAKFKHDLLYNRYQAGRDVIASYTQDPPYAYLIPQRQRDPVAPVELLRRLAFNGIEVHQLTQSVTVQGQPYEAGTWVIAMDQPFANFVRQLFAIQEYPDLREFPEGPPDQPYDVAGWTLPYQMGVHVVAASEPLPGSARAAMQLVEGPAVQWNADIADAAPFDTPRGVGFDSHPNASGIRPLPGLATGTGAALTLDPAQNNVFRAINRAWRQGGRVQFVVGTPGADSAPGSTGRYQITGLNRQASDALVTELALQATREAEAGVTLRQPRIGLYRPWVASIDEGWTRWLAETYDFEITSLYNADILAGRLHDRYDVIVLVDISSNQILNGHAKGAVPPRYAGGIGVPGVRALDEFVTSGGTLVTLNESALFAIEQLHLPVSNAVGELENTEFFLSGSLVEMITDPSHPVMSGMPTRANVFVDQSPVFTVKEGFRGRAFAKYGKEGSPLVSGYLLGPEHLHGLASGLDVRHGAGRVVLLGMRPQWRGQPFGTFRVLFNSMLYTSEAAAAIPDSSAFWTAPPVQKAEADSARTRR